MYNDTLQVKKQTKINIKVQYYSCPTICSRKNPRPFNVYDIFTCIPLKFMRYLASFECNITVHVLNR